MTGDMGTIPKGNCSVCGRLTALTGHGRARQHRTLRVDSQRRPYTAADTCLGSGEPPTPWEGPQ